MGTQRRAESQIGSRSRSCRRGRSKPMRHILVRYACRRAPLPVDRVLIHRPLRNRRRTACLRSSSSKTSRPPLRSSRSGKRKRRDRRRFRHRRQGFRSARYKDREWLARLHLRKKLHRSQRLRRSHGGAFVHAPEAGSGARSLQPEGRNSTGSPAPAVRCGPRGRLFESGG